MARFVLPPGATLGAKMSSDGTVYLPNRRGSIEVDNPRHIAELRKSNVRHHYDMLKEGTQPVSANWPDRYCPKCLFNNAIWRDTCVRCNTELE